MKKRTVLFADEGMMLTNGSHCGRVIWLAEGVEPASYHQITEEEYRAIAAEQEVNE